MSSSSSFTPFYPDCRGNRLASWAVRPATDGHVLWLRGAAEVALQVMVLAPEYEQLPETATACTAWTHALKSPDPSIKASTHTLLDLLTEIVTLPSMRNLDFAVALDWYKVPEEDVDSYQWRNTLAGELVNSGKHRFKNDAELQRKAGLALADLMCESIERHGVLRRATVVLDVPGHDSMRVSFGSRLAATIAKRRGTPLVKVMAKSSFRPEAKSLTVPEREDALRDQFVVPIEVEEQAALIVDDVVQSGASMKAVAKAAREAGARAVQGISGARTIRR